MKILQLISSGGYYGAESVSVNLAKSLAALGHTSTLGLFSNTHMPENDVADVARSRGVPVETITCNGRMDWNAVRAIRELVQKNEIDVVHAHGYKADAYALAANRTLQRRLLVATCHNWLQTSAALRVYQRLDLLCLRRFEFTVAVSAEVAAALRSSGIPEERIRTIANGVDLSAFQTAHPTLAAQLRRGSGLIVGMVGRLEPNKGQRYLLRAAPAILTQFPDTMFVFAGDGPAREDLERLAQQLRISENVRFLGKWRDMPGFYSSLDIFTLPSLQEGMPMVVLEALASGKPVVATPVGDIPHLVKSGQTGLIVRPRDAIDLGNAILRLLSDSTLREELGSNGANWVRQECSAEMMARRYLEIYAQGVLSS